MIAIWAIWSIGLYLSDWRSGALGALLFTCLPVVIALSHESKPHLPGAALMLWACYWALRYIESGKIAHRVWLAICCGLAFGTVLTSLWIFVLVPLAELLINSSIRQKAATLPLRSADCGRRVLCGPIRMC